MNKTKSSEPTKKKGKWLTPSKIPEHILDSKSDESESGTLTTKEQESYEEAETERFLQEKWAYCHSWYTENCKVQVRHSPSLHSSYGEDSDDDDNDDDDHDCEENGSHTQTFQQQTTTW